MDRALSRASDVELVKNYASAFWCRMPNPLPLFFFYFAYVLAGGFGQGLALIPGINVTYWPPAGIFVAALLLNSGRTRWWITLAACAAELTCNAIWFHNPIRFALVYFAANLLEAFIAAWLMDRFSEKPFRLESMREVLTFLILVAICAPVVGATIIALTDAIRGRGAFMDVWPLVWLGDASGLLISAPLTVFCTQLWRRRYEYSRGQVIEAAALGTGLIGISMLTFRDYLPTVYMTLPIVLWASLRFQLQGAAISLAVITLMTAIGTMLGNGEFAGSSYLPHQRIIMLQTFLGVSAVSALLVVALSLQRQQALRDLQAVNAELEERVAKRTEQLRADDRQKDEFLATLAHELRNPLAPIRNGLQIIKLSDQNPDAIRAARDMMERQADQMTRLIDDLMDLSRIRRGKIVLQKTRMRLSEAIQNAIDTSRPLIDQQQHRLEVEHPHDSLEVDGDLTRLSQVFANLLNNAAKYTEPGGRIRVQFELQPDPTVPERVVVHVEDNGVGIPEAMLGHVFDMFAQVNASLERSQGGLGIGLNIVRRLVELHGGEISVESEGHNRGSRFSVALPLAMPQGHTTEQPAANCSEKPVGRRRILVMDDNLDGATSLAMMLSMMGHEARTAQDGLEAIDLANQFRPDVILMDIGMPRMNGFDACRRLRSEAWGSKMIIIAQTGWGQEDDKRNAIASGFDHHLTKPVEPAELVRLLEVFQPLTVDVPNASR